MCETEEGLDVWVLVQRKKKTAKVYIKVFTCTTYRRVRGYSRVFDCECCSTSGLLFCSHHSRKAASHPGMTNVRCHGGGKHSSGNQHTHTHTSPYNMWYLSLSLSLAPSLYFPHLWSSKERKGSDMKNDKPNFRITVKPFQFSSLPDGNFKTPGSFLSLEKTVSFISATCTWRQRLLFFRVRLNLLLSKFEKSISPRPYTCIYV